MATYKGGYGFHPIYCFADAAGESLGVLQPGNAGAKNIADHVTVLDQPIVRLPEEVAAGHRPGDDPALVRPAVQVRTDSAGCSGFRVALPGPQRGLRCRWPAPMPRAKRLGLSH